MPQLRRPARFLHAARQSPTLAVPAVLRVPAGVARLAGPSLTREGSPEGGELSLVRHPTHRSRLLAARHLHHAAVPVSHVSLHAAALAGRLPLRPYWFSLPPRLTP